MIQEIETKFKVYFSDSVVDAARIYGLDITSELTELISRIRTHQFRGILKLHNTRHPLFRFRTAKNTRLLFDYGRDWLRIWRLAPRKEVYRHLPTEAPTDPHFELVFNCTSEDAFRNDEHAAPYEEIQSKPLQNFNGHRFYYCDATSEFEDHIRLQQFLDHICNFNIVTTPEQREFINSILHSKEPLNLIQGTAGSGKTTCAVEYAMVRATTTTVILLVPTPRLKEFVSELIEHKISEQHKSLNNPIKIMTLQELYIRACPDAECGEESIPKLIAEKVLRFTPSLSHISPNDIYQILVAFSKGVSGVNSKDNLYGDLREKVELILNELPLKRYEKLKSGKPERFDRLDYIREMNSNSINTERLLNNSCLIIDEVQDLLCEEWQFFIDLLYRNKCLHSLLLLGDIHQRVTITNFTWSQVTEYLHSSCQRTFNGPRQLIYNYRTTRQVCALMHYLVSDLYAGEYVRKGNRHLPTMVTEDKCMDSGAMPQLIVAPADQLFQAIESCLTTEEKKDSDQQGMWTVITDNQSWRKISIAEKVSHNLLFFTATQSKGVEFENVIILNAIPDLEGPAPIIEITRLYTAISRAKKRVLLFLDQDSFKRLKKQQFDFSGIEIIHKPEAARLSTIIRTMGANRISEEQLSSGIIELIENFGETYLPEKVKLIVNQIEGQFNRLGNLGKGDRLLTALYNMMSTLLPTEHELENCIHQLLKNSPIELQAIMERAMGHCQNSIGHWLKSNNPRRQAEMLQTIEQLWDSTALLELVRSIVLVEDQTLLKRIICENENDRKLIKELAAVQLNPEHSNLQLMHTILKEPARQLAQALDRFNKIMEI